ncbi:conserved exported hypothetical protein [Flavobacterium sp. 9AF]|uniref:hypothetical protein n=1 Tax=Flavobacterium sp. 9AF TaxID=2653142 RepID=UPI0012EF95B4|nr:hypothetical protein [Flavobacterium sp. 9AF]VXB58082.1 conserved exported hypothetical protein [Flavobacterium sp. 9AF]
MITKLTKAILVCFSLVVLTSCSVEDGKDGQDGVGFEEIAKFGAVNLKLTGTRPDNVPFSKTTAFKFTSVEGSDYSSSNSVQFNGDNLTFNVLRYLSSPDDVFQESTVSFNLDVTNAGLASQTVLLNSFRIENFALIGDDLKYFVISDNYSTTNAQISDYNFDNEKNKLDFKFSFNVPAASNDSGHDLTVEGEASVIVLELINNN